MSDERSYGLPTDTDQTPCFSPNRHILQKVVLIGQKLKFIFCNF